METNSEEPENKLHVTDNNENESFEKAANGDEKETTPLETEANDDVEKATIPLEKENYEKKATTKEAFKSTEMPEKEINSDSLKNDEQALSESKQEMDDNLDNSYAAMKLFVRRGRTRRRKIKNPRNQKKSHKSSDSKASSLLAPLKRKWSRRPKSQYSSAKRISIAEIEHLTEVVSDQSIDMSLESKDDVEYCLTVSNLPNSMSFMEIKNYFDTEVGPVDEIEMLKNDKTGFGAIRLTYQTERECIEAKQKLRGKVVAGNKLTFEMAVVSLESDTERQSETTEATKKPWKPDLDFWEVDLEGLYGLKLQYLKSLGITPPLDKWVHVSNFRCDKSELCDVLELAGNVQMCSLFTTTSRYANVMYSHPLEAVQAVAMLHNQQLYGQQLKVAMDRTPTNTILLPKGLSGIGSGLGLNGKPLKNIVKHYERFLENKESLLNPIAFNVTNEHCVKYSDVTFEVKSVEDFNYPIIHEVTAPAPPIVTRKPTPKAVQTPSPKPKLQAPAYTQKPATTEPVYTQAQAFQSTNTQQYNAAYNTFVAPHINNGMGQGSASPMGLPMQNTALFSSPIGPGPMIQGPMGPGSMGSGSMGTMGPGPMGHGHMGPMGPLPMGPTPSGPGPMSGSMGQVPMSGPMGQVPMSGTMGQVPMSGTVGQVPMSGPMGQGPMSGTMGQGPMGPGPIGQMPTRQRPVGPGPIGIGPMGPGPMGPSSMGQGPGDYNNEPVKMLLRNLPPSTTFALLCDKMSEWGHVVCLQLTTPGCAVVTFGNRMQADACFRHYNGRSIENHIIQMQYA